MISHQIVGVNPSLAAPLEFLGHRRNIVSHSLFYRYYFGRCSSERMNWFHFLLLMAGPLAILTGCMIFLF